MALDHAASPAPLDSAAFIDHLRHEAELFADAVRRGPLDAPISACPGWDLRRLAEHLTSVHMWARTAASTGERVAFADPPTPTDGDYATPYVAAADSLIEVLDGLDPDGPTWHIFPVERVNRVWPRRQAHETLVHRWDAEQAVALVAGGSTTPMSPELASDGIDEYFEMMLPRLIKRSAAEGSAVALPTSSLHVHCLDTHGEWLVSVGDEATLVMTRAHAKGDAALRGRAEDLLLRLWGRPVADGAIDVVGRAEAASQWLALGGA